MLKKSILSFFSCAGFLDLGFEHAGYDVLFANEVYARFAHLYKYSRIKIDHPLPQFGVHEKSAEVYLRRKNEKRELARAIKVARQNYDLVGFVGGPPCPDFSIAGKNKGAQGSHGRLTGVYVRLICKYKPDFFLFENVKGLITTKIHREYFDTLQVQLQKAGYKLTWKIVNALEYGVPQKRERIIMIGFRNVLPKGYTQDQLKADFKWTPEWGYCSEDIIKAVWPTMEDYSEGIHRKRPSGVIEELTVQHWFNKNDVDNHPNQKNVCKVKRAQNKFNSIPEGDDGKKSFRRLHRWRFAPTAAYGHNEVHIHPYWPRRLTVAEALATQSLPKNFILDPALPLTCLYKAVGNGVPYLVAKGIAEQVTAFLDNIQLPSLRIRRKK